LAQRALTSGIEDNTMVKSIFERILVRSPKDEEFLMLNDYYHDELERFSSRIEDANELVALGEFQQLEADPAKTAALMLTAQVIYNLDETITKE